VKIAVALGLVSVLILAIHHVHNTGYHEIQESFDTVYKDRLVVESYIYEMSGTLNEKKWLTATHDVALNQRATENDRLTDTLNGLIARYDETLLTEQESVLFSRFKQTFGQLAALEARFYTAGVGNRDLIQEKMKDTHQLLHNVLHGLSRIQLAETQRIIADSNRVIAFSGMTSQIQLVVIIFIGLIGQVLLFATRSPQARFPQQSNLN
jgi:hypothetical protein